MAQINPAVFTKFAILGGAALLLASCAQPQAAGPTAAEAMAAAQAAQQTANQALSLAQQAEADAQAARTAASSMYQRSLHK
jgi:hypothetical protein